MDGSILLMFRRRVGLSQSRLAAELGISERSVRRLEKGGELPIKVLLSLARLAEGAEDAKELALRARAEIRAYYDDADSSLCKLESRLSAIDAPARRVAALLHDAIARIQTLESDRTRPE